MVWGTQQFRNEDGCEWVMVRKRPGPKGRGALSVDLGFLYEIGEVIAEGGEPGRSQHP